MISKSVLGWGLIVLISLLPVLLLFAFGPGNEKLSDYSGVTQILGEIFGLVAITMFALTFILSARIGFIEELFGGLDKVYIAHGLLGGSALILILFHPILLVLKFIPRNFALAADYILPSSHWSVNFGIIALLGFIFLISLTLFVKLRYDTWKFSHEFLGLVFLFAVLHMFLVRTDASQDYIFSGYYVYASMVSFIGLGSFGYSLFIKGRYHKTATYRIKEINRKNDVFEILMDPEYKPIHYRSGQFVFIRFYNKGLSREDHPFSIASKSDDPLIRVIVKRLGDYTDKIEHLKAGDRVSIEGPYGRFTYDNNGRDQVWIAGGIGITPFLGMVQDYAFDDRAKAKVSLFHTVRAGSDFIGYDFLRQIETKKRGFRFIPWDSGIKGHLTAAGIEELSGSFKNKEYFLCGPEKFKESIISQLLHVGVPRVRIHEEAFDFI